jgi:hypothetical protein
LLLLSHSVGEQARQKALAGIKKAEIGARGQKFREVSYPEHRRPITRCGKFIR